MLPCRLAFWCFLFSVLKAEEASCPAGSGPGCQSLFTADLPHHWPRARGHVGSYGVSNLTAPADISKQWYTWTPFDMRFHSTVLCGPLIDHKRQLYVTAVEGIFKLTMEGKVIWSIPGSDPFTGFSDCTSLMNGALVGISTNGQAFAADIETGRILWIHKHTESNSGDTAYVENHQGIVVYQAGTHPQGGGQKALAVNGTTGDVLWEFQPDNPLWNMMAVFPDDGTVIFQDHDAVTYSLWLHNGTLIWKNGGKHMPFQTWSDGGCMLGPNGIVYAASSKERCVGHHPTCGGGVHAYNISDGKLIWEKHLLRPFFTWPVVGTLAGRTDRSVIVAIGSNAYFPWKQVFMGSLDSDGWKGGDAVKCLMMENTLQHLTLEAVAGLIYKLPTAIWNTLAYSYGYWPAIPIRTFEAEIYAFNAETGEQQWEFKLPNWPYISAAGDNEGYWKRLQYAPWRPAVLPAAYSSPSIDATGTVYIGYHDGLVYGLKDTNGDGIVSETEVVKFDTKGAFLHSGPAFAPGIFGITSTDTLHMWKTA